MMTEGQEMNILNKSFLMRLLAVVFGAVVYRLSAGQFDFFGFLGKVLLAEFAIEALYRIIRWNHDQT